MENKNLFLHDPISRKTGITLAFGCSISLLIAVYAKIGYDLLMLLLLFISCWCVGALLLPKSDGTETEIVRIACGISIVGIILYLLLLLGWGGKTQYAILLLLPLLLCHLFGYRFSWNGCICRIQDEKYYKVCIAFVLLIAAFWLVFSSAPIDKYDSLTGHLPITMYAARHGEFNRNIAESITYSQTGMLFYGFSTLLASFGAYKAMTMLNVILAVLIFLTMVLLAKKIERQSNVLTFAVLFFSVPMFFEFATVMYIEMLPIFLTFAGFLTFADLQGEKVWRAFPILGLLFGCAVMSKLTICYTILAGGLMAIFLYVHYSVKAHIPFAAAAKRFLSTGILFVLILAVPLAVTWYQYGNPVFPWFNGIFQSPYFAFESFVDPFNASKLGFSLHSLTTMVFHTSCNIEMHDGGVGIYLLFIAVLPISWVISKNKKLCAWGVITLVSYAAATLFTYNLRYYMAIFMLIALMISMGVNVIINRLAPGKEILSVLLMLLIAFPGYCYIVSCYPWETHLTEISDEISTCVYSGLLKEIPSGKRVFSSEPYKGDYDGYLSPNNWHGTAWQRMLKAEGISTEDYVSNFDYYISNSSSEEEALLLKSCKNSGKMDLELLKSENGFELYQIHKLPEAQVLLEETFPSPIISSVDHPYTASFALDPKMQYQITQDVENASGSQMHVRFQINWMDADGQFVDTSISVYSLSAGERQESTSELISPPEGAVSGILYLSPHDSGTELIAHGYILHQVSNYDVVEHISESLKNRVYLSK